MRQNKTTLPIFSSRVSRHLYNSKWEYHATSGDSLVAFQHRQHDRIKAEVAKGQRVIKC